MDDFTRSAILFVQEHQRWGISIVFLLAFCESFAFISLLVPATGILFGVGGLAAAANIQFWPIWFAAASGAVATGSLTKLRTTSRTGSRDCGHLKIERHS